MCSYTMKSSVWKQSNSGEMDQKGRNALIHELTSFYVGVLPGFLLMRH